MLAKLDQTERILILAALILLTLIASLVFASTLGRYIESIQPTPTLRSLPPIVTATLPALPTLHPTSTPFPSQTPAHLPSPSGS
jgi:hypothetical protein